MPRKSMETLTESMFYVLMALMRYPMCGIEIAEFIDGRTEGRVRIGPATLYTILGKFREEAFIRETEADGRKRIYFITNKGIDAYMQERHRLQVCLSDAAAEDEERNCHAE